MKIADRRMLIPMNNELRLFISDRVSKRLILDRVRMIGQANRVRCTLAGDVVEALGAEPFSAQRRLLATQEQPRRALTS